MVPSDPARLLSDTALEQEITLLADVMDTVTAVGRPLHQSEVDRALGLDSAC
ncbi:hypothetical protein [Pedococcus sp. 5OH_020]|uniref:hypothetical protein n=1 Tax=Pedococcus sp. 5OH_020 TaxID=2989814 RepID=UPI0022E9FFB2|nr:hypothetical protein [Pedococcus sp. 5OH_020]